MVSIKDCVIHWTPKSAINHSQAGTCDISPLGVDDGHHLSTTGGCWAWMHDPQLQEGVLKSWCFIQAMHMIIRDGVDPMNVHKIFMHVEEYRDGCSADMPGMSHWMSQDDAS